MVGLGLGLFASGLTQAIACLLKPDAGSFPRLLRDELYAGSLEGFLNLPYRLCRTSHPRGSFEPLNTRNTNGRHFSQLGLTEGQQAPSSVR